MSEERVDVVIPLSNESCSNNDELRICLRSIDKYAEDVGRVIICTTADVPWLSGNVDILAIPDSERHLKDANLIHKVLTAIEQKSITGKFAFFSDDQCILKSLRLAELPPIYNNRSKEHFNKTTASRWQNRLLNTFNFLENRGIKLTHNYESHTPQVYEAPKVIKAMTNINYRIQPGFTINTLFMGLIGITGGVIQNKMKVTLENEKDSIDNLPLDKYFCGYKDEGFQSGLRELLFKEFSNPCKYEK